MSRGLDRWAQLSNEGNRLKILHAVGRYEEVLSTVRSLREELLALPEPMHSESPAISWNVREAVLDAGRAAATELKNWKEALDLNEEIARFMDRRKASVAEVLRVRLNNYSPLLRLRRCSEARALLDTCRAGFETVSDIEGLGKVLGARAELENQEGQHTAAFRFEQSALRYAYQAYDPEDCANSHHNLAGYLERAKQDEATALAQRLAAAVIRIQIGSGRLATSLVSLAIFPLPAAPPTFAEVVTAVEQTEGVRFEALFARLPKRFPDGDAALAAVWEQALKEKARFSRELGPVLRAFAAAAHDESARPGLELLLDQLAKNGWELTIPVRRIWAGERDIASLTAGIDRNSGRVVQRILEVLEVLSTLPPAIQAAFQLRGDVSRVAMNVALAALPPEEAQRIVEQLRQAGIIG